MKYTILINQKAVVDNALNLDILDLAIFDYIKDFCHSNWIKQFLDNWKTYYWISYQKIIKDMPLLWIKSKSWIYKRIKKLTDCKVLESHKDNQSLSQSFFAFWLNYKLLIWGNSKSENISSDTPPENHDPYWNSSLPPSDENHDNNIINNSNIKIINKEKNTKKEKLSIWNEKTPRESARDFFSEIEKWGEYFELAIKQLVAKGFERNFAVQEIKAFCNYWREKTPSGKKELWETKPTFEIQRRLVTWFRNKESWNKDRNWQWCLVYSWD